MVLYARGNFQRKAAFQILTTIELQNNTRVVYKRALNKQAEAHLAQIAAHYDKLADMTLPFKIVQPIHHGTNELSFAEVPGIRFDAVLREALASGSSVAVASVIDECLELVDALPKTDAIASQNKQLSAIFGPDYNTQESCAAIGLIDFGLDNFIKDKQTLYLIDYEWLFDFPIPISLLKQRLLIWILLFSRHHFMASASAANPLISLSDYLFIPEQLYTRYKDLFKDIERAIVSEHYFQNYVNQAQVSTEANLQLQYASLTHPPYVEMPHAFHQAKDDLHAIQGENYYYFHLAQEQDEKITALSTELHRIKNSRTWKLTKPFRKHKD